MSSNRIPIYFVPGLAADVSIFEFITLPAHRFDIYTIAWKIPKIKESLRSYAARMATEVKHTHCVLVGVSFGGILVQEMQDFLDVKKIIIISSVKTKHEFPQRIRFARKTKLYKLLPTTLVARVTNWESLAIGDFAKKRAVLYQKYIAMRDPTYLDWAIQSLVCWDRETPLPNILHIHGDKDLVFPIANITNCIVVPNGTHVMILNYSAWISNQLLQLMVD